MELGKGETDSSSTEGGLGNVTEKGKVQLLGECDPEVSCYFFLEHAFLRRIGKMCMFPDIPHTLRRSMGEQENETHKRLQREIAFFQRSLNQWRCSRGHKPRPDLDHVSDSFFIVSYWLLRV